MTFPSPPHRSPWGHFKWWPRVCWSGCVCVCQMQNRTHREWQMQEKEKLAVSRKGTWEWHVAYVNTTKPKEQCRLFQCTNFPNPTLSQFKVLQSCGENFTRQKSISFCKSSTDTLIIYPPVVCIILSCLQKSQRQAKLPLDNEDDLQITRPPALWARLPDE